MSDLTPEKEILYEICQEAFDGNIDALRTLLENNKNINLNQIGRAYSPLQSAIENENVECVKLLIEKGADVNFQEEGINFPPIMHAVDIAMQSNLNTGGRKEGDESTEIVQLLLAAGADPAPGLRMAQSYGSKKIISFIQEYTNRENANNSTGSNQ